MKKLSVVLFAALLLAGCGGKEKQVICTEVYDGDNFTYEFNAKGDEVNTHVITVEADLAPFEFTEEELADMDTVKEFLDDYYMGDYLDLKGITITSSIDDTKTKYNATTTIDFNAVDFKELEDANLVDKDTKAISLEMTIEDYENCKETEK